jgi:hypothetical protein
MQATIRKPVKELQLGDEVWGIDRTVFTEPHTVVKVSIYRWDGEVIPCAVITDKGGCYDFDTLGRFFATVTA